MKKVLIVFLFILALKPEARIDTITNQIPYPINIRAMPSGDAEIVGQFNQHDVYEVDRLLGDWAAIQFDTDTAYSYRKELVVNQIRIIPFGFQIPVELSYSEVSVRRFSDAYSIGGVPVGKSLVRAISIIALLFFWLSSRRRKRKRKTLAKSFLNSPNTSSTGGSHKLGISADKKTSFEKGTLFESYIADKFSNEYYRLMDWTSDKSTVSGNWAESNLNPDLKFKELESKQEFYVECKYRSSDEIYIDEKQLRRYRAISARNKIPAFLAIGTGGKPNKPKNLYLIPIYRTKNVLDLNSIKNDYRKKDIAKGLYYDPDKKRLY